MIQLLNMITRDELFDTDDLEQVKEDVNSELSRFGDILAVHIPVIDPSEPKDGLVTVGPECGKIFIKFNQVVGAKQARYQISGRTYNGRTVVASFYPEHIFDQKQYSLI